MDASPNLCIYLQIHTVRLTGPKYNDDIFTAVRTTRANTMDALYNAERQLQHPRCKSTQSDGDVISSDLATDLRWTYRSLVSTWRGSTTKGQCDKEWKTDGACR
jgi:hypothetical protein